MILFFGHYRKTKANKYLLSLSLPSSVFKPSPRHRPVPLFMHLPRLLAGLSVRGKGGFIFFSFFLLFFLHNLLPSETINAHSTSTSRHSFDVYSGNGFLSFSAACCSLSLSFSLHPPPLPPPHPFPRSLRLHYHHIKKWSDDKIIFYLAIKYAKRVVRLRIRRRLNGPHSKSTKTLAAQ